MWNVSVINKGKKWIDLEVVLAHPDAGSFAEDPVLALEYLTSEAYGYDSDYNNIPKCPLGEAIDFKESYLPSSLEPRVDEFIENVVIYEAHNVPFEESEAHEKVDQQVLDSGIDRDDDDWDEAWEDLWRDFWDDKSNLPWARYRIWVTDEKWIEHLTIGQAFDTASFSESGPWIDDNFVIRLEEENDAEGRKSVDGFNHSEVPPRENTMDMSLIRSMTGSGDTLAGETLREMIAEHQKFLLSGGSGGSFMRLEAAGLPLNIYNGSATEGTQLEIRLKKIEPGTDLSGVDLSYADLSGVMCEGVNFSGAILDGAILTDSFFANASFDNASVRNVDFSGSDLSNASFRNTNLENADFEIANCQGADFTGAHISTATFKGANLDQVKR